MYASRIGPCVKKSNVINHLVKHCTASMPSPNEYILRCLFNVLVAAFAALARDWGLFAGALRPSQREEAHHNTKDASESTSLGQDHATPVLAAPSVNQHGANGSDIVARANRDQPLKASGPPKSCSRTPPRPTGTYGVAMSSTSARVLTSGEYTNGNSSSNGSSPELVMHWRV